MHPRSRRRAVTLLCLAALLLLLGCTEKQRARRYGGHSTLQLPRGHKLVTVTWKEDNIWVLSRKMHRDESPEKYLFQEDSSWGVLEGKVYLEERR